MAGVGPRWALQASDHPWWRKPLGRKPRHINPERCAGKVSHSTWRAAEDHLLALIEQDHAFGIPRASLGLVSYRCSNCGAWHVGHGIGADPQSQGLIARMRAVKRQGND